MRQQVEETARDAILVEDAALIRMMGMPVLEALPSRAVPYRARRDLVGGGERSRRSTQLGTIMVREFGMSPPPRAGRFLR